VTGVPVAVPIGHPVASLADSRSPRSVGLLLSLTPTTHYPSPGVLS
jgi:hypothetical protein